MVIDSKFAEIPYKSCEIFRKTGEQKWVYNIRGVFTVHSSGGLARKKCSRLPILREERKIPVRKRRIPPMLTDLVQMTLASCDGVLFDHCGACPGCGVDLSGYDVKKKQFAILITGGDRKVVFVRVKRFRCRQCGQVVLAEQPYYPDTRIGSPVVDLCRTLGETMAYGSVSSCLGGDGNHRGSLECAELCAEEIPPGSRCRHVRHQASPFRGLLSLRLLRRYRREVTWMPRQYWLPATTLPGTDRCHRPAIP